jgi:hypothetical protein
MITRDYLTEKIATLTQQETQLRGQLDATFGAKQMAQLILDEFDKVEAAKPKRGRKPKLIGLPEQKEAV